jgi:hypothetical protein
MNKQEKIDSFVSLRANNFTFDDLVKKLVISKPTLIAWGKKYNDEINLKKKTDIIFKYAENIFLNESTILINAEQLKRYAKLTEKTKLHEVFKERIIKRLDKIFQMRIKNINFTIDRGDNILELKFEFGKESDE